VLKTRYFTGPVVKDFPDDDISCQRKTMHSQWIFMPKKAAALDDCLPVAFDL